MVGLCLFENYHIVTDVEQARDVSELILDDLLGDLPGSVGAKVELGVSP